MSSKSRRTNWRRHLRSLALSVSALLAISALALPATAQLYYPPLMRKVIPGLAAAQQQADTLPKPTQQVMVKFRRETSPAEFARVFSATFSARDAQAKLARRGIAKSPMQPNAPALSHKFSLQEIGWHVYRLPSSDVVGETLEALRKRPEVLLAVPDNPTQLLIDPPPNPQWNDWADEFIFSLLLQNYGGYNGSDSNPFLPPGGGGVGGDGGFSSIFTRAARYYDSSTWKYRWHHDMIKSLDGWGVYPGYYPSAAQMQALPLSQRPLVAVIDTGVDMNHPAFRAPGSNSTHANDGGMIQRNLARSFHLGNNGDDPNAAGYDPDPEKAMDSFGHGTSVAGLIGAAANSEFGIPGVGITCRIVPVRIYGANGDGNDSDLLRGIRYAVNAGCVVINVSARTNFGYSPAFQDAVNYAWDRNALVVAAIGNDAKDTVQEPTFRRYPASLSRVLAVGGTIYAGVSGRGTYPLTWEETDEEGSTVTRSEDTPYTDSYFFPSTQTPVNKENLASYSNFGLESGVVAPAGDGMFFANAAPANTGDTSEPDNLIWQYLMQNLASPPPNGIGLPLGAVPEYVCNYTTAPTYLVPMNDNTHPSFGGYAAFNLYHLGYGTVPGTSFSAPVVAGLAALYCAKNGITQATPGAPQQIIAAIQRGSNDLFQTNDEYRPDNSQDGAGHFFTGGWSQRFGYGRVNVNATLRSLNTRNATVGGVVGVITNNGVPSSDKIVEAIRAGYGSPVAVQTGADGVYRLRNLTQGVWQIKVTGLAPNPITRNVTVGAGYDMHAVDFGDIRVNVTPKDILLPFGATQQFAATVGGTDDARVTWSLPDAAGATINSTGLFRAPNALVGSNVALVQARSRADTTKTDVTTVTLVSRISGTVNLQNTVEKNQPMTFVFKAVNGGTDATFTQTLDTSGNFSIVGVEPGEYRLAIKGAKWLRKVVDMNAAAGNVSGVSVSLLGGDGNNDNAADIMDLTLLIAHYNKTRGNTGYLDAADFNCDGANDINDLLILISNYNRIGQPLP